METSVTFANEISRDFVGRYYGFGTNLFDFMQDTSRDYRKAVFAVLDVISTDSLMIMGDQHLPSPILSLSTRLDVTTHEFWDTSIVYANGTFGWYDDSMGLASIYNDSVYNLAAAVTNAVYLDLGNVGPKNIFIDPSAVNDTFLPNLAPPGVDHDLWVRDGRSFYYGEVVAPYQTWAQMLRMGLPQNITLGNLSGLPEDSQMVTNYLCPSYQLKSMFPFLGSVFIGTASMYTSAWAGWLIFSAVWARWLSGPCYECTFGGKKPCKLHHPPQGDAAESGLVTSEAPYRPSTANRDSGHSEAKGSQ